MLKDNSSIKNILLFFISLLIEFLIIALILIFTFNLRLTDILNDVISQDVKNIYFILIYISLLLNLYFFSKESYIRLYQGINNFKYLFYGLFISFSFITSYYIVLYLLGFYSFNIIINISLILQIIILSFLTAFIEEMIFRDYLFSKFSERYTVSRSIVYTSYIYAQLHFLRFNLSLIEILIPLLSLFFFGVTLSKIYIDKGIFYSIGLHWGFIIFISYINQSNIFKPISQVFITGGLYPPTGLLACFILFLITNKLYKNQ